MKLTIEAIPAAAFVACADGTVVYTNAAARRMLAASRPRTRAQLKRALRGHDGSFSVTGVTGSGHCTGRAHHLLVHHDEVRNVAARVSAAASQWKISGRQAEVLALVIDGHGNASIAEMLGIAVRTVEGHVSALFLRAHVESRSALVARVLSR